MGLYFHFQLLTNLAEIAGWYGCPEQRKILCLRTVRTLLVTGLSLPVPWARYAGLTLGVAVVNLAAALWICSLLFSLRSSLEGAGRLAGTE